MSPALPTIAGWDVPLLRGAVGTLDVVTDRLTAWRARAEAVGRALEAAQCWSGPAGTEAARAVVDLSDTTAAGVGGLTDALAHLGRMVGAAAEAQEAAAAALAAAAAEGVVLAPDGAVVVPRASPSMAADQAAVVADRAGAALRVGALADQAAAAAAVVALEARAAEQSLLPPSALATGVPATAGDLLVGLGGAPAWAAVPVGADPTEVARWWASLSASDQLAAVSSDPRDLGGLDGIPAWARDRANRLVLADALAGGDDGTARAVADEIDRQEAAGRSVQLWLLDLDDDLAALAVGDLDTADAVAVLVPGILTDPGDDLPGLVGHAADVADRAQAAAPGATVAALAWIGYRTPSGPLTIPSRGDARVGGPALAAALDGLAAARSALAGGDARTTVLAHSYGTVVADEAADAEGQLAADAVVLLGSPGGAESAAALEAPEVYDAFSPLDPVSYLHWFGPDPWRPEFGATELPVDPDTMHWDYYDRERPTLDALAAVVAGTTGR